MAELKRQTFLFSNGKQIRLYGTGFGITKSLEIGEAFAPNIFSLFEGQEDGKPFTMISNQHRLTEHELHELAEYNIRLWLDLKDSLRRHGEANPKVFNRENIRLSDDGKPEPSAKKEGHKSSQPKEKNNSKNDATGSSSGISPGSSKEEKTGKNGSSMEEITGSKVAGN
ncbi:MAG: hypothetical protein ABI675_30455 [Chitinophagaceae bacterium]